MHAQATPALWASARRQVQTLGAQVDGGPVRTAAQRVRPCSLDAATQKLIANIFSQDMFRDSMALLNLGEEPRLRRGGKDPGKAGSGGQRAEPPPSCSSAPPDVKKMPLGKLSKQQIARGFEALEALEAALKGDGAGGPSLEDLSSHFYTVIPHNFGRSRPPPITSPAVLQAKKDMLLVRPGAGGVLGWRERKREGGLGPSRQTWTGRGRPQGSWG